VFSVPLDSNITDHVKWLCKRVNYGHRGEFDGSLRQQMIGLAGQCHVMDMMGFELPKISHEADGGVDINYNGLTLDVKTMERKVEPKPSYVNNVVGLQSHYKTNAYIFCSLNTQNKMLTVCGWIDKPTFLDLATFTPKGQKRYRSDGSTFETKADLYELENSSLNQLNSIQELKGIK
jgi:hypothetical protein